MTPEPIHKATTARSMFACAIFLGTLLGAWSAAGAEVPLAPADFDRDGDVDQDDYATMQSCVTGRNQPIVDEDCLRADVDFDGDIDLIDLDLFEECRSGALVPADPGCLGTNFPPEVHAGEHKAATLSNFVVLEGVVTDDGLPEDPGFVSITWAQVTGPGQALFTNPSNPTTAVRFTAAGDYWLRLIATDGEFYTSALTYVRVIQDLSSGMMAAASRTTGVAPLGIFFDAVNPASGVVQPSDGNYARISYEWYFGDPGSGNWSTTGRSKNRATGYVAAHVYEQPGIYNVQLAIRLPDGTSQIYTQQIEVTAFSGTTYYCSSSSGSDSFNGLSPQKPFKSVGKAMSQAGPNVRILFKRGDKWTVNDVFTVDVMGPGIIAAYYNSDGSDDPSRPKPRITQASPDDLFRFRLGGRDWRVCDLELTSLHDEGSAIHGSQKLFQNLILRCDASKFGAAYLWTVANHDHDENFIVESTWTDTGGRGVYLGGHRGALLGNYGHDCGEHILRVWHSVKFVIGENILQDPPTMGKASLKLHNAPGMSAPTEYVIVSGNTFRGDQWPATFGPQNTTTRELVRRLVIERNKVTVQDNGRGLRGVVVFGPDITVRNNLFNGTGSISDNYHGIWVEKRGIGPMPDRTAVYNNTVYRTDGPATACGFDTGPTGTVAINNLTAVGSAFLDDSDTVTGAQTSENNFLLPAEGLFANPAVDAFLPNPGTPPIDAGETIPGITVDYALRTVPLDGNGDSVAVPDVGAFERP